MADRREIERSPHPASSGFGAPGPGFYPDLDPVEDIRRLQDLLKEKLHSIGTQVSEGPVSAPDLLRHLIKAEEVQIQKREISQQ